jgi:hypothetical protein
VRVCVYAKVFHLADCWAGLTLPHSPLSKSACFSLVLHIHIYLPSPPPHTHIHLFNAGIDTFDCVHPTRIGRHGCALVMAHHWCVRACVLLLVLTSPRGTARDGGRDVLYLLARARVRVNDNTGGWLLLIRLTSLPLTFAPSVPNKRIL